MSACPAIEVIGLRKSYGQVSVLTDLDLRVPAGTVFALLGPNGAGKTTTVRILATLTAPDAGRARVAGFDVVDDRHRVRRAISLTGQQVSLDEALSGEENLRMIGGLRGLSRADRVRRARELLDRFDLLEAGRRQVATYSGGMRRRLDLAASLVARPSVIFLDEPTTGLDPRARQATWEMVTGLAGSGTTVLLTTQYLEEADRLADTVAVMDAGRIVARGAPAELKGRVSELRLELTFVDRSAYERVAGHLGDRVLLRDPARLTLDLPTDGDAAGVRRLLDEVDPDSSALRRFALREATLDDVFLTLTGRAPAAVGAPTDGSTDGEREVLGV